MNVYPLAIEMVGQGGLEPPTPSLSGMYSNLLSYWPPDFVTKP